MSFLGYIKNGEPEPYLLGSSPQSAVWAAELGLPYVFADFINPAGEPYAAFYREHFTPSSRPRLEPQVAVCAWAVCAETTRRGCAPLRQCSHDDAAAVPRPVDRGTARGGSLEFLAHEGAPLETLPAHRRVIAGDPVTVRAALEDLARDYHADEVFVVNILYNHAARLRSYEFLADAFR